MIFIIQSLHTSMKASNTLFGIGGSFSASGVLIGGRGSPIPFFCFFFTGGVATLSLSKSTCSSSVSSSLGFAAAGFLRAVAAPPAAFCSRTVAFATSFAASFAALISACFAFFFSAKCSAYFIFFNSHGFACTLFLDVLLKDWLHESNCC